MKLAFLVIGIVLAVVGVFVTIAGVGMDIYYCKNCVTCAAVITDIDTEYSSDSDGYSYYHTYYGEYTVNGKLYTDKEIYKSETNSSNPGYSVGQVLSVNVDGNDPETLAVRGTMMYIVGLVLLGCAAFNIFISKKIRQT